MKNYVTPFCTVEMIAKEDIILTSGEPQDIENVGTVVKFRLGRE